MKRLPSKGQAVIFTFSKIFRANILQDLQIDFSISPIYISNIWSHPAREISKDGDVSEKKPGCLGYTGDYAGIIIGGY